MSFESITSPSGTQVPPVSRFRLRKGCGGLARLIFLQLIVASALFAQVSATLSGTVTDQSGAAVSGADITATDLETGAIRTTSTGEAGQYKIFSLPIGAYEVRATKQGFAEQIRTGIRLAIGQDARVDVTLRVGPVSQQIEVNSDAPLVSVSTEDVPGLVGEQQVKNLPLNGRSYDLLLPLNPGIVNFTSEKTGGIGISNSTTGNNFAVSGNRPQQNLFLLNGVEYTGAAENNMQPGGPSQQLLGVDAVREFNVLRDSYGAEYGKRPGRPGDHRDPIGQQSVARLRVRIPAQQRPGCSQLLRPGFRSALQAQPVRRLAGRADRERQDLCVCQLRRFPPKVCTKPPRPLFPMQPPAPRPWRASNRCSISGPRLRPALPTSTALPRTSAVRRKPFARTLGPRASTTFSPRGIRLSAVYTIDDGGDVTATPLDPYSTDILNLREQVVSLEETHVFSPTLLNTARIGFSRAGYFFTGEPTPGTPAATFPGFCWDGPWARSWWAAARPPTRRRRWAWPAATMEATSPSHEISYVGGSCYPHAGTPSVHFRRMVSALPIE